MEYLRYFLSKKGIAVDSKKVNAVKKCPIPKNISELQLFLKLASYYRKFVKSFSAIANIIS